MFVASKTRPQVRHYLELICKVQIDWEAMGNAMNSLHKNPAFGLNKPLSQATPVFDE
jgi:hypothetical protein